MGQFGVKRDKYDITFSRFIKLRDRGVCQRCGKSKEHMETSHLFSRRKSKALRCDPSNACLKCNSCHGWWHSNPIAAAEWLKSVIGELKYYDLMRRANTPTKFSQWEKDFQRSELQEQIKRMEAGEILPCFNPIYR